MEMVIIKKMAAPKGNEYYKLRSKDGRDRIFKTPQDLLNACNEYFEWCLNNPLYESQVVKLAQPVINKKTGEKEFYQLAQVPHLRPFTLQGLCNYIDIAKKTFDAYGELKGFCTIVTRVRQIVYNQKFEGAASGFLKESIITRDLGLAEKLENKNNHIVEYKNVSKQFPDE